MKKSKMPVKKIVVTYDFTDETYDKFYKTEPGRMFMHLSNMNKNLYSQQLFNNFASLNIEVDMLTHSANKDIPSTIIDLEKKLESADLIFHETPRIAFQIKESSWKNEYQKAIENLVHSKFLNKTHFFSNDINNTDKQNGAKIAKQAKLPLPKSCSVNDYFASNRSLPVILKLDDGSGGIGIYFIDKPEQIDTFWDINKYRKLGRKSTPPKKDYEVQDFIKTPSNHFTHYRIFALGNGTIVGAVLNVSGNKKNELERVTEAGPFGLGSDIYNCVDSPIYLGCLEVCSNHQKGGSQIPFDANKNSKSLSNNDKDVLIAHGYDLENITLNPKLKELATKTAREFSKVGVLYSGQDWMQDTNGNFFFLEINPGPGLEIFNTLYNKGRGDAKSGMEIGTKKIAEALANYKI